MNLETRVSIIIVFVYLGAFALLTDGLIDSLCSSVYVGFEKLFSRPVFLCFFHWFT